MSYLRQISTHAAVWLTIIMTATVFIRLRRNQDAIERLENRLVQVELLQWAASLNTNYTVLESEPRP